MAHEDGFANKYEQVLKYVDEVMFVVNSGFRVIDNAARD